MNKKLITSFLALFTVLPLLNGCTGQDPTPGPGPDPYDPSDTPIVPEDTLLEAPSWAAKPDELVSFNQDAYFHSDAEYDTTSTYAIKLEMNDGESINFSTLDDYIRVYDSTRIEHSLVFSQKGTNIVEATPNVPYEVGRYYTIDLLPGAPYHFYKKDPTMTTMHFDVKGLSKEKYDVQTSVKRFFLSDIISKQDMSQIEEGETHKMILKRPMNINRGDSFLFWDGEKIDLKSFYGTFQSEVHENGAWTVYFTDPDLGAIFGEDGLDVCYEDYLPEEIYDLVLCSEKSIQEDIANSSDFQEMMYQAYLAYEPNEEHELMSAKGWIEAMKNIRIIPKFGFTWPGWSFSITVKLTVPFKYASITIMFTYYRKSVIQCDASLTLRKFLGIPYWADLAVDISETVDSSTRFTFAVGDTLPHTTDDDEEDYNHLSSYVTNQSSKFEEADKKFQTIKDSKADGVNFDGKSLTIELGKGRFPLGAIFDFFIDFSFVIKIEASVMLNYSYTEHSVNHILSYRSGDDDKSSHSVAEMSSSTRSLALIGTIGIDAGIHLKFGIGVCGLEDYISFSIYCDVGIYLTIGGYGYWTWTNTSSGGTDYNGLGSFLFEVGWYVSVGIQLQIFFIDLSLDLVAIRKPFFTTADDDYFINAPESLSDIKLETHSINVKDLHLLTFNHFSYALMRTEIAEFDPETTMTYRDNDGTKVTGKPFKFSFKDGTYIRYENGKFIIPEDSPTKFEDTLYVDVPESLYEMPEGKSHFIEVKVIFYDYAARPFYVDNEYIDDYRYGDHVSLPDALPDQDGIRFYGWKCVETGDIYAANEVFIIPVASNKHDPIHFERVTYPIIYHTVNFYDNEGNLLSSETVEEGLDAVAPTPPDLGEYIIFMGWSTSFQEVYYDLDVYAIYLYVDVD